MRKDKVFETIVRLVQEAFKDAPSTIIHQNYKIKNRSGRNREIDILIESKINGVEIKIAFECKDHSKPIAVEKVEAFNSKCIRIPGISKKIIVSRMGFQTDAILAARDFDIDLKLLKECTKDVFTQYLKLLGFSGLQIARGVEDINVVFKGEGYDFFRTDILIFPESKKSMPLIKFIESAVSHRFPKMKLFVGNTKDTAQDLSISFSKPAILLQEDNEHPVERVSFKLIHKYLDIDNNETKRFDKYSDRTGKEDLAEVSTLVNDHVVLSLVQKQDSHAIDVFMVEKKEIKVAGSLGKITLTKINPTSEEEIKKLIEYFYSYAHSINELVNNNNEIPLSKTLKCGALELWVCSDGVVVLSFSKQKGNQLSVIMAGRYNGTMYDFQKDAIACYLYNQYGRLGPQTRTNHAPGSLENRFYVSTRFETPGGFVSSFDLIFVLGNNSELLPPYAEAKTIWDKAEEKKNESNLVLIALQTGGLK